MIQQLTLTNLERRFQTFHAANPQAYEAFKRFDFQAIEAGQKRIGAKAVWERLRWSNAVETKGDKYKLNNDFTPYYSRLFQSDYPEHAGLFATRKVSSDWWSK